MIFVERADAVYHVLFLFRGEFRVNRQGKRGASRFFGGRVISFFVSGSLPDRQPGTKTGKAIASNARVITVLFID